MSVVHLVGAVAARQHGAVSRSQLLGLGATEGGIRRAVERGDLVRRAPSVYVIAGAPTTWRQALVVAVLDAGPGACVSHRAAAVLLGIARRGVDELVEISVPRGRTYRMSGVIVHSPLDLVDEHITIIDGIPCSNTMRTLVDLGAVESFMVVKDALERALQAGLCSVRAVEWMLAVLSERGRAGCGVIRLVLTERELRSVSPHPGLLEPRFAGLARRFRLPAHEYQHKVLGPDGRLIAQVDFAFLDERVAIEVDGFEHHGTPEAMSRSFERDQNLREAGWEVLHFTWFDVLKRPDYVARRIRKVLAARSVVVGR